MPDEEEEFPKFYVLRPVPEADTVAPLPETPIPVAPEPSVPGSLEPQIVSSQVAGPMAKEGHLVFAENRKGVSFEKLFAPYLDGAKNIVVTDPYIRHFYQARNMMELLELIIRRKSPEDQVSVSPWLPPAPVPGLTSLGLSTAPARRMPATL